QVLVLGDSRSADRRLLRLRHERAEPRQPLGAVVRAGRRLDLDVDHSGAAARRQGGRMRFRAKVLLAGKTATGVEVPAKVVDGLGSTRRPLVRVTINGFTYRSAIAPMGGTYMLGINEQVREGAQIGRAHV